MEINKINTRTLEVNIQSVEKVFEWIKIQKPENAREEAELNRINERAEFVKSQTLKNGEVESVVFGLRINEQGMLVGLVDDRIMIVKEFLFQVVFTIITLRNDITIKELVSNVFHVNEAEEFLRKESEKAFWDNMTAEEKMEPAIKRF